MTQGHVRALLLTLALARAACAAPQVRPDPPVLVAGCALTEPPPPPPMPPITFADCPGFEACLTHTDAVAFFVWERATRKWSDNAWTLCHSGK